MCIVTRSDATPVTAQSYPLAIKHHDFLKQEIKNLLMQELFTKACAHGQAPLS